MAPSPLFAHDCAKFSPCCKTCYYIGSSETLGEHSFLCDLQDLEKVSLEVLNQFFPTRLGFYRENLYTTPTAAFKVTSLFFLHAQFEAPGHRADHGHTTPNCESPTCDWPDQPFELLGLLISSRDSSRPPPLFFPCEEPERLTRLVLRCHRLPRES